MSPTIRNLLASLLIAAVAPMGLAVLDLEQPAYAKDGGGKGGGNGGGNGGGKGGGNGGNGGGNGGGNAGGQGDHGNKAGGNAKGHSKAAKAGTEDGEEQGMKPNELGKLNGVLHASDTAVQNASPSSPLGMARQFGEALAGFLGVDDEGTTEGEGDEVADETTIDNLGGMMAGMTNKTVTGDQVQAVADKVGVPTTDAAPADDTTGDTADEAGPALDQETADAIAAAANNSTNGTIGDDTDGDDDTSGDDTADAGDTGGEETATN
jgi:hypothetical protein